MYGSKWRAVKRFLRSRLSPRYWDGNMSRQTSVSDATTCDWSPGQPPHLHRRPSGRATEQRRKMRGFSHARDIGLRPVPIEPWLDQTVCLPAKRCADWRHVFPSKLPLCNATGDCRSGGQCAFVALFVAHL